MGRDVIVALCLPLLACSPCRQLLAGDLCGDREVTVAFTKIGWFPTLPAVVDGISFNMLVDTGASCTILSATRSSKNQNELGQDVAVSIGGMTMHFVYVWYMDSPFSAPSDDSINGILGGDLLRDLDYRQTQTMITLSEDRLSCTGPVVLATNRFGPKILLPPMLVENVSVSGSLLDTGAALFLLSDETAKAMPASVKSSSRPSGYCVFDGCHTSGAFTTTLGVVCLGEVCENDIQAKYPSWDAVGQSWLQRHKAFIVSIGRRTLQICR